MSIQQYKTMLETPLSDKQLLRINPDASILLYPQLNQMKKADDIFKKSNKVILFFEVSSPNSGHWTCLMRRPEKNEIEFFDSYGFKNIDDELNYIPNKSKFHEAKKQLSNLLYSSPYKIIMNHYKLQKFVLDGIETQTCGRHTSLRLLNSEKPLSEFVHETYYDNGNINIPSDIVACIRIPS